MDKHVLIIDDEAGVRESLALLMSKQHWRVSKLASARQAKTQVLTQRPDLVISDVRMPGITGLQLFDELHDMPERPPFIFISAHADVSMAVAAMQKGAYTFFEKPYEPKRLLQDAKNAVDQHRLEQRNRLLSDQVASLSGLDQMIIGNNTKLIKVRRLITQFAEANAPVMISGETGTGKELAAKALHALSSRVQKPFITVDCTTFSEHQFAQAMFGSQSQQGYVDKAAGGTLFLDELRAFSLEQQGQLLRLLETGEFQRVDSIDKCTADLRIVSATNADISELLESKVLRKDLVYRLDNLSLYMPPLRQSSDDIVLFFNHFLHNYSHLHASPVPTLTPADLSVLLIHTWPGNVRELRHVAQRMVLSSRVDPCSVEEALYGQAGPDTQRSGLRSAVAEFEKALISKAVVEHHGRMDDVATALSIGRRTLNEKMVKLDLDRNQLL